MTVQQGQLAATDTGTDMENFYNDAVVTKISDVNRIIHNGTQFVRLVLQRAQATSAARGAAASPTVTTNTPHYIDGLFTANPSSGIDLIVVGFSRLVSTTSIKLYSTSAIDTTLGDWTVSTSLNNLDSEFSDSNFVATVSAVAQAIESTPEGNQFTYTLTVGTPPIDTTGEGLPFWRIVHADAGEFNDITEVQIVEPLTPSLSYFDTNGDFASSFPFEKSNILDACFDTPNNRFYSIRFNNDTVGTSTITLNDNFGDSDAGTASGTNNFNPSRWDESSSNTQFLRTNNELSYNTASGKGQLETTYTITGNFNIQITVEPDSITAEPMWFSLRTLDVNKNTVMSEGMGIETSPTTSGVFFASYINNLVNSTANCDFKEGRPLWHNAASGTDAFTVAFDTGISWTVSGTQTGALTNATTGVPYNQGVDANTPIEFLISCTAAAGGGDQFTFDLVTDNVKKNVSTSGNLAISRTGSNFTTSSVITSPTSVSAGDVSVELFGNTNGSITITADDYKVLTGSGIFGDVAVFTVEKVDADGLVQGVPVINAFDVIGDPSLTYNDFLDGRVQIACTSSGGGPGSIYIKIDNQLFKYDNSISLGTEDGTSATQTSLAQIAKDGTQSFTWTHESSVGGNPFLTYVEFDEDLDIVHLQTIDKNTLQDTTSTKEVLLDISDFDTNRYEVFYDQNDFDTLRYVDSSTNLQSWNLDDRISAFMAVNAEDVTLPAGTAQDTPVNADVINAWGEVLAGKTVTFAVTAGDGAVSPSSDATDGTGRATTTFTVGSTVGVSTVTAQVTES